MYWPLKKYLYYVFLVLSQSISVWVSPELKGFNIFYSKFMKK